MRPPVYGQRRPHGWFWASLQLGKGYGRRPPGTACCLASRLLPAAVGDSLTPTWWNIHPCMRRVSDANGHTRLRRGQRPSPAGTPSIPVAFSLPSLPPFLPFFLLHSLLSLYYSSPSLTVWGNTPVLLGFPLRLECGGLCPNFQQVQVRLIQYACARSLSQHCDQSQAQAPALTWTARIWLECNTPKCSYILIVKFVINHNLV